MLNPSGSRRLVVVAADDDDLALRRTLCSILDRAAEPVAVTVVMETESESQLRALATLDIEIQVAADGPLRLRTDTQRLTAGEELPWGWPYRVDTMHQPTIAYLLPGLPAEGSGGSHSVVQEARALRGLGAGVRVCLPDESVARAEALYGNEDSLFVGYSRHSAVDDAVGDATVAVATEHGSVPLMSALSRDRPTLPLPTTSRTMSRCSPSWAL